MGPWVVAPAKQGRWKLQGLDLNLRADKGFAAGKGGYRVAVTTHGVNYRPANRRVAKQPPSIPLVTARDPGQQSRKPS